MNNKENIRKYAESVANGLTAEERRSSDSAIFRSLATLEEISSANTIFCFVGVGSEPNTMPLIRAFLKTGRRVAVPRCGENGMMDAVEISGEQDLHPGKFGIPEPPQDAPALDKSEIDAAVVPGVVFDGEGGRLGRGGGYYDRWLSDFAGFKCGVCRDVLVAQKPLPREEHDVLMDAVVTDRSILRMGESPYSAEVALAGIAGSGEATTRITKEQLASSRSQPHVAAMRIGSESGNPDGKTDVDIAMERSREPKKRERPLPRRRNAGIGCMRAIIWFVLVIGISASLAGFAWLCADDLLSLTSDRGEVTVTISASDDMADIADTLKDNGLIKYTWLFKLYGKFSDAEEKIEPGTYTLDTVMDYRALVSAMRQRSSYRTTVDVTIPEGFTVEQIIDRLAENGVSSYDELADVCANHDFEYSFLAELPYGETNRLEGYLFPDTYTFYVGESPVSAVDKLLSNFSKKFTSAYREKAEELGYSQREILVIASLIEKEAADSDEMSTISSVIHNRLDSDNFPRLQIDATIQYILEERKPQLSYEDLQIDNPYNTYLYDGLPPGPICCPGDAAIKAALYPKNTDYYYYALTSEGVHEFARTAEEHQKIIDNNPEVYGNR